MLGLHARKCAGGMIPPVIMHKNFYNACQSSLRACVASLQLPAGLMFAERQDMVGLNASGRIPLCVHVLSSFLLTEICFQRFLCCLT